MRARDLVIHPQGAAGVPAVIERLTYQGGYFRVEARPLNAGDVVHLDVAEPVAIAPGDAVTLGVIDGWVIPGEAA